MDLSWEQLGAKLISTSNKKGLPLVGQFELTSRCNLNCSMCYVRTSDRCVNPAGGNEAAPSELTARQWIKLAEQAKEAGTLYLLLTGGEVFTRSDFRTIYEEIAMMGFNIELLTNATLITPEIAQWLGRVPPSTVGITLYGASAETYGQVCGNPQAYEQAINGIKLLLNEGLTLLLKTTVVRSNVKDFRKIADFSFKENLEFGIVNYISPRRDGCNTLTDEVRLSPEELVLFEADAERYLRSKRKSPPSGNIKDVVPPPLYEDDNNTCTAGRSAYWITSDGRMTACGLMEEPFSLPVNLGLAEAWKLLKQEFAGLPKSQECSNCELQEYCMTCPARLKNETGFYNKASEYICKHAQYRKILSIKGKEE